MTNCLLKLSILVLLCTGVSGLIIPEELPTILSLIYSNIPPIRKGTDSRVGVGFRLGQHADFQVLLELGPQIETEKLGNSEPKRRRETLLNAEIRDDVQPWSKSAGKFNPANMKEKQELKAISIGEEKDSSKNWLITWSNGIPKTSEDEVRPTSTKIQRIRMPVNRSPSPMR